MTRAELETTKKALAQTRRSATESRAAALAYLQKMGLVTRAGKLTKRYSPDRAAG